MNNTIHNHDNSKRYKHKITYWLPAIIYIILIGLWISYSENPVSPTAIFIVDTFGYAVSIAVEPDD